VLESLRQDVRLGVRRLRRTPGFAATAILVLALGIGLSTAVFTVADALLLRRLPVVDQDRLVVVAGRTPDDRIQNYPLDVPGARDFARQSRALDRAAFFAYFGSAPVTFRDDGRVTRMRRALVSGDFFATLGTSPALGRALRPEDDREGAAPAVVLSHRAWRTRFGGDPRAVGRSLVLHEDGVTYTIVGVMPPGLDFPRGTDVWMPTLAAMPEETLSMIGLNVVGRLAAGATPERARDDMTAYFRRAGAPPHHRELRGVARTLSSVVIGETRPAVLAFGAAAALLLVVTCINVANLLLVRGMSRVREVAVRSAVGASRARVAGQLLAEHAVLAAAGGALGLVVAVAAVRGFVALAPAGLPRLDEVRVSGATLAAAAGITCLAMLAFGLAPALLASRVEVQAALRSGARQSAGRGTRRATEALVAGQVALAVVVLSAAALIGRSLLKLERADLSFDGSRLLVAELSLPAGRYETAPQQVAMLDRLLPAVRALPGVRAASPVVAAPFAGSSGWDGAPTAEGQGEAEAATNPMLNMEVVTPEYFSTLGVPLRRGRALADADREGAPAVVVLSESAARHYWPGADPLGKRLRLGPPGRGRTFAVVGVVADTRYRDLREARPSIYFPLAQSFFPFAPTTLVVRASGPPSAVVPALRRVVEETAPGVAVASATPFDELLDAPLAQPRLNALLLGVFAAAAVTLASVGLFGVLATMVRQRTREIGVRVALGASGSQVRWLVLRRGLTLAAAGTAAGLLGALAANRLLAALLFEVAPTDALTLGAVALGLLAVAALASVLPARAGARVDPNVVLRAE
jgi:predicted permease